MKDDKPQFQHRERTTTFPGANPMHDKTPTRKVTNAKSRAAMLPFVIIDAADFDPEHDVPYVEP